MRLNIWIAGERLVCYWCRGSVIHVRHDGVECRSCSRLEGNGGLDGGWPAGSVHLFLMESSAMLENPSEHASSPRGGIINSLSGNVTVEFDGACGSSVHPSVSFGLVSSVTWMDRCVPICWFPDFPISWFPERRNDWTVSWAERQDLDIFTRLKAGCGCGCWVLNVDE